MLWKRKARKRKAASEAATVRLDADRFANLTDENVLIGYSSIVGTREDQQDAMLAERNIEKKYTVAIVCDGMGGMQGGSEASRTAVEYIADAVPDIADKENLERELLRIVRDADRAVYGLTDAHGNALRAGTTMVMALIREGLLHWASVGDSKIYLLKQGVLKCITNEHNYDFMVRQKSGDAGFRYDPNVRKDALVSYLGAGGLEYVDINQAPVELHDGDMLLLCSDGLYKNLSEEAMTEIMQESGDMDEVAENMTAAALVNARGSQDNTTVIILKYKQR